VDVAWLCDVKGHTPTILRALSKNCFRRLVSGALWRDEWYSRVQAMRTSARLHPLAAHMLVHRLQNRRWFWRQRRWSPAAYLHHVGGRTHAWLLTQCRLGLLALDEERGRWAGIPRDERRCSGCVSVECGVYHFLQDCPAFPPCQVGHDPNGSVWSLVMAVDSSTPGVQWRVLARLISARWRAFQALHVGATTPDSASEGPDDASLLADELTYDASCPPVYRRPLRPRVGGPAHLTIFSDGSCFGGRRGGLAGWGWIALASFSNTLRSVFERNGWVEFRHPLLGACLPHWCRRDKQQRR